MPVNPPVLGIDLGTTNSVVAVADGAEVRVLVDADGEKLVPSVVSFHPNGEVIVGRAAKERRLLDAKNTVYSVKRLIGRPFGSPEVARARERFPFRLAQGGTGGVLVEARGETYTLAEISAFVLKKLRAIADASLGVASTRAVITVPANFNELQRSATKAAGRVAGLDVLRILNEPTAAALAYGFGKTRRERIAVYDLGGGTFDVTVLELAGEVFEVLATAGDTYLGGDDVDSLLADRMALAFLKEHGVDLRVDRQTFERLRAAAEWAKCQLSSAEEVRLRVEELGYGEGGVSLDLEFATTRRELEALVEPLLLRTHDTCEEAMRLAQLRPSQLDSVILVGGSTRMPLVRRLVSDFFGQEPLSDIDPDLVVAEGAAIQGHALATARGSYTVPQAPVPRAGLMGRVPAPPPPVAAAARPPAPPPPAAPAPAPQPIAPMGAILLGGTEPPPKGPVTDRWSSNPAPSPSILPIPELPEPPAIPVPRVPEGRLPTPATPSTRPPSAAPAPPPLLLDVTPLSLGVETVGGYCERIIGRNSAIPVEQSKVFSTARDDQLAVTVRICQGESRRLEENQLLGELELDGLPAGPRGSAKIGVTFLIDADGSLGVTAKDLVTGREQRIRIHRIGALADEDIDALRARHEAAMP